MNKHFFGVWLIYWGAIALLPVKSVYPATAQAFLLQFTFVFLVLTAYGFTGFVLKLRKVPEAVSFDIPGTPTLIKIALGMSFIGFVFLIYDKVYIQGINYSEGVAVAREQWRQLGEDRAGQASSVFSIFGYLFGSAYYVAAVLAITQIRILSASQRIWILITCFLMLMGNSVITGGRSNVVLLGIFIVGAMVSRRGLSFRKLLESQFHRWTLILAVGLAASYTVFIFYERADASELSGLEYVLDFLPFLGLEMAEWYQSLLDGSALSSLSAMLVLAVSYVTHSFATTAAIIDGPTEDKTIIFVHMVSILSRLGLSNNPDNEWFLAGRFPSFPGALWHQFGVTGFFFGSILLGIGCAAAAAWTAVRPARLLPLGVFVMAYVVLILTPLLFVGDFLSFPFVAVAFFILALIGRLLRPQVNNALLVSVGYCENEKPDAKNIISNF